MEISDYLQEGDIGFKKPKVCNLYDSNSPPLIVSQTKKKRPSRRVAEDSGIDNPQTEVDTKMDVDEKPMPSRVRNLDSNFVDDDELQASLARARREKMKRQKPKVLTQEEIAQRRTCLVCTLQIVTELVI